MKETRILTYDGPTVIKNEPAHGSVGQWKRGTCWSAWCNNPIFYVHISPSGYATHGYCPHVRQWELYEIWPRGTWYMIVRGKLKEVKRSKSTNRVE